MARPQWQTPERQRAQVKLFAQYGNQCTQGHRLCRIPGHYQMVVPLRAHTEEVDVVKRNGHYHKVTVRHRGCTEVVPARRFDLAEESAIESWKAEDRETLQAERELEGSMLQSHDQRGFGKIRHPAAKHPGMDPVERLQYLDSRPAYYLLSEGVHPLTHKHTVRIRVAGTNVDLFVDVSPMSKNARRKLARYGQTPTASRDHIRIKCEAAVRDFWVQHPR